MNWLAALALHSEFERDDWHKSCPEASLEHPIVFVERFWKWRNSLFLVACRILGDSNSATEVVEVCFRKACRKPPKFESDGAFGSWLLRVLIDEALQARVARQRAGNVMRHKLLPKMPRAMTCKLKFMDEFWCLETNP
jgi:DNA-directed RNA polymerase specialized sigma24 family protein